MENTGGTYSRKRGRTLLPAVIIAAAVTALFFFIRSRKGTSQEGRGYSPESIVAGLPDAAPKKLESTKKEAYQQGSGKKSDPFLSDESNNAPNDGAGFTMMLLSKEEEDSSLLDHDPVNGDAIEAKDSLRSRNEDSLARERVFGSAPDTGDPLISSSGIPYGSEAAENIHSDRTYVSPESYPSSEERLYSDIRRAVAIKEALEGRTEAEKEPTEGKDISAGKEEQVLTAEDDPWEGTVEVLSRQKSAYTDGTEGIITYLDAGSDESHADGGLSSERVHPIKCAFIAEEKVKSGTRVALRVKEDSFIGERMIPEGTTLYAVCTLGERLFLEVRSIPFPEGGSTLMKLSAFDSDGMEGLYCPRTATSKGSERISREGISKGAGILGGAAGGLAGSLLRSGAAVLGEESSKAKVRVYPGYEFELRLSR